MWVLQTLIDCPIYLVLIENDPNLYSCMDLFQSLLFCLTNPIKYCRVAIEDIA